MRAVGSLSTVVLAAAFAVAIPAAGQDTTGCFVQGSGDTAGRPSPLGAVTITLGGEEAKLCYGRPSAKGRTVMGGLVPHGQPWRTGANEATALHLPFAAEVGGVALQPGVYSLYTIPGQGEWEIVLNSRAERWGIPISAEVRAADVGSFKRPATPADNMVETLTFRWESHGDNMGHLIMEWENTRVEIPIHRGAM